MNSHGVLHVKSHGKSCEPNDTSDIMQNTYFTVSMLHVVCAGRTPSCLRVVVRCWYQMEIRRVENATESGMAGKRYGADGAQCSGVAREKGMGEIAANGMGNGIDYTQSGFIRDAAK